MATTSWCGLKRKAADWEVLLLLLEEGSDILETVVPLDGCQVRVETYSLNPQYGGGFLSWSRRTLGDEAIDHSESFLLAKELHVYATLPESCAKAVLRHNGIIEEAGPGWESA